MRVLLADDHAVVREGLALLINGQPDMEVCGEAEDGNAVLGQVAATNPDVLLLDVDMPGLNGLEVARKLVVSKPALNIVVLTVHDDAALLKQVCRLRLGGYVLKKARSTELLGAIRTVAAGGTHYDTQLLSRALLQEMTTDSRRHAHGELSEREREVLVALASGFTNKEIAGQLGVSVKTVETYRLRLGRKLGRHTRAELVSFALEQGWVHVGSLRGTTPTKMKS